MESPFLIRKDECIFALAYCVRQVNNELLKVTVYNSIADLLITDDDLFKFIMYATLMNKPTENEQQPKGFGRGMKKAVSNWYHKKTPLELANMLGAHRGFYNWTHKDLITMCHVKFDENDEKLQIIKAMFNRGVKVLKQVETQEETQTEAMKRLCTIFRLKICENKLDAARMYIENNLEFEHIPAHMYNEPAFWDIVMPTLNYKQLVKIFLTLNDLNLLSNTDELSKKLASQLGKKKLITDIEPLQLLSVVTGYEKQKRYPEAIKVCDYLSFFD